MFDYHVIDGFLPDGLVKRINEEWPSKWDKEEGTYQRKWNTTKLPPAAEQAMGYADPLKIGNLLGIEGLFSDPDLYGAGLHCIPKGGFLKMHVDFNQHPMGWHRRANCLIYLNEDWDESWGGHLCLGEDQDVKITPIANRCVIFETTEDSWHGHPTPLNCPEDRQRRSLALYFYTENPPPYKSHSTVYKKK